MLWGRYPGGENDLFIKGTTRRSKAGKAPSRGDAPGQASRSCRGAEGRVASKAQKTHPRETQQEVWRQTDTEKRQAGEKTHRGSSSPLYCMLPTEIGSSTAVWFLFLFILFFLFAFSLLSLSELGPVILRLTDRKRIQTGAFQNGS